MNVLHLRNRQDPRKVTLEMLAKIAVLIDYYECSEAVEIFSGMWIDELKNHTPIPRTYCRDLVLWICIAWVFRLPEQFRQVTAVAVKSKYSILTLELPAPWSIIGRLAVLIFNEAGNLDLSDRIDCQR
ncbi:hypothetical protein K469DRAFT_710815 [Zopfia rhizophila CBS 207.26]|uniref:Uncharacterized protein n=1 Tax=Zopfia rhizophila CBS 207.26 TaxID=1314779 RepID=A0A6A6DW73_9PEZI|nr:hypothetical protein K469DRAFT_710815 [Zopfia rhizophila CBS 207.26]